MSTKFLRFLNQLYIPHVCLHPLQFLSVAWDLGIQHSNIEFVKYFSCGAIHSVDHFCCQIPNKCSISGPLACLIYDTCSLVVSTTLKLTHCQIQHSNLYPSILEIVVMTKKFISKTPSPLLTCDLNKPTKGVEFIFANPSTCNSYQKKHAIR